MVVGESLIFFSRPRNVAISPLAPVIEVHPFIERGDPNLNKRNECGNRNIPWHRKENKTKVYNGPRDILFNEN